MSTDPARVNQYDPRTYTRRGLNSRVVVREKPLLKSRMQRIWNFMRPTMRIGHSVIQGYELTKVMACIVFPLFILVYWKYVEKGLPDSWERQFGGLQHKQFRDDQLPEQDTDYFSIIETFQQRRDKALKGKQSVVEGHAAGKD